MEVFLKIVAGAMIGLIMYLVMSKQNKDFSLLLTICICCMILVSCAGYLSPIIAFLKRLENLGGLDSGIIDILLRSVGIGFISQVSAMVCNDAGNSSLAKTIQFAATALILWISLPLFESMLELVTGILGDI